MAEQDYRSRKAGQESGGGWFWWAFVIVFAGVVIASIVTVFITHKNKSNHKGAQHHPSYPPLQPLGSVARFSKPLELSLLFLDAQKSGKLPKSNPITWRGDSGISDGKDVGLDLSKGLYDAGDNMKFGFPMAFTATILAWSLIEYKPAYTSASQLDATLDTLKWITDFLLEAHPSPDEFYFQVGDPASDHVCWEKPETMDTPRPCYKINATFPGSDVAGESAAALAATSIVFKGINGSYSEQLLASAKSLFRFADENRGSYSVSFANDKGFYNSTGYLDELLWAASWLYHATGDVEYLEYATSGDVAQAGAGWGKAPAWFSWDDKAAGLQVLLSRKQLFQPEQTNAKIKSGLQKYKATADQLACAFFPDSPTATTDRTAGGMIWVSQWNSIQHAVNSAFLACVYADYLSSSGSPNITCSGKTYQTENLREFAGFQADYFMGKNPLGFSYIVGYGEKYPLRLHHRAASIPTSLSSVECKEGFDYLHTQTPNPNVADGALVGGPFKNDTFVDDRDNSMQNEATSYNSAALTALSASLLSHGRKLSSSIV